MSLRSLVVLPLAVLLLVLAAAPAAFADVRRATAHDGPDPGVTFDIAQVHVTTDRDAGTLKLEVFFHAPVPDRPDYSTDWFNIWINDAEPDSCVGGGPGTVGDTSVAIRREYGAGRWQATYHVNFRREYPAAPITWSADRKALSVEIADELLRQSNHRCLDASSSGQGNYDPSKPGGGSSSDSIEPVWFDGQAPAPEPAAPMGVPRLSLADGAYYTRVALRRRFRAAFTSGYGYRRSCRRVTLTRVRCRVRWHVGDLSYAGPVTIWLTREGEDVLWNYAYTIKRTNHYCVVTGGRRCTRTYRVT